MGPSWVIQLGPQSNGKYLYKGLTEERHRGERGHETMAEIGGGCLQSRTLRNGGSPRKLEEARRVLLQSPPREHSPTGTVSLGSWPPELLT